MRFHTCWLLTVLALLGLGTPVAAEIPTTPESPYVAAEGKALLVFARSAKWQLPDVTYTVVDEGGRCLGVLGNGWTVAAPVRPGRQRIMVLSGTLQMGMQLLRVRLDAGKTYVIRLDPSISAKEPIRFRVLRAEQEPFPSDILGTTPFRSLASVPMAPWEDLDECSASMRKRAGKLESKSKRALEDWSTETKAFRDARTVRPNDGYSASEVVAP